MDGPLDSETYPFVDDQLRKRCREAVARGISCILKCQIVVKGKKTAWCAQGRNSIAILRMIVRIILRMIPKCCQKSI